MKRLQAVETPYVWKLLLGGTEGSSPQRFRRFANSISSKDFHLFYHLIFFFVLE